MEKLTVKRAMELLDCKSKSQLAKVIGTGRANVTKWGEFVPETWAYKIHFLITEKNKETADGETA